MIDLFEIRYTGPAELDDLRMTGSSSGIDLKAKIPGPVVIPPGGRTLLPTGIRLEIPHGLEGQVRPRSGLAIKHGVTVLNSPGTIDADYRGEVAVILVNLGQESFEVTDGMRVAQLVFARVEHPILRRVEKLGDTARGAGGFGSTGS